MTTIIGVRFRGSGKVYYFDPAGLEIPSGADVIVETARGVEIGSCAGSVREVPDESITQPLKKVIRVATAEDTAHARESREKEIEAMVICKEKIRKHGLEMKLIDAEYTFDRSKILFYFTAEGRIDFRELVKDLASVFRTRIELRQIGVRDETKILGGIGICGRPLCCHTWLTDFVPVSIKMAKEQNLSLNPTKISGVCGRLMCCLKNEQETYEYLNSKLPAMGETVYAANGVKGEVAGLNVLRQRVKVLVDVDDEKEIHEFDVTDLHFKPRRRKDKKEAGKAGQDENAQAETPGNTEQKPKENAPKNKSKDRKKKHQKEKERSQDGPENKDKADNTEKPGDEQ